MNEERLFLHTMITRLLHTYFCLEEFVLLTPLLIFLFSPKDIHYLSPNFLFLETTLSYQSRSLK
jgi:hypothetical protein